MSTEQQPPPPAATHKAEPNALATGLSTGWEQFKQGKLLSYPMMALILVVVAGIGVAWWIVRERTRAESAKWVDLDGLTSPAALEEFAKKYPNTIQAKIAELEVARGQLGPDGIERLTATDPAVRKAAVESVEKARDTFARLSEEFKDDPIIRVECMLACGKAEAVLIGKSKDSTAPLLDPTKILEPGASLGNPANAIEWLDRVTEAAPDTDWGKDAKKLADTLRNAKTLQDVINLQGSVYLVPTLPKSGGPKGPFDPQVPPDLIHGGPGGP
jgi:hypothetical protein